MGLILQFYSRFPPKMYYFLPQTGMTLVPGEPLLCVVLLRYSGAVAGDITVAGTRLFLNASVGMFDLSLVPGQFSIKQVCPIAYRVSRLACFH